MFGKFNEAGTHSPNIWFAEPQRPHGKSFLRLLVRPYTLLYVERSMGRL